MNKAFEDILEKLKCEIYNDEFVLYEDVVKVVKEVAKSYNNGWIPCSERLPKESLNSLLGWDAYRQRCVFIQYVQGRWQNIGKDEGYKIVAWQPLPDPFKED